METLSLGSGIGIGIAIGVILGFALSNTTLQTVTDIPEAIIETVVEPEPIIETVVEPEPGFAEILALYDEFEDKTTVVMYLTDNDGDYIKANGDVKITLCQEVAFEDRLTKCFSRTFNFEKGDFYTRESKTGHRFVIDRALWGGGFWQASMDINLDNEMYWTDVDTRFYSLED